MFVPYTILSHTCKLEILRFHKFVQQKKSNLASIILDLT